MADEYVRLDCIAYCHQCKTREYYHSGAFETCPRCGESYDISDVDERRPSHAVAVRRGCVCSQSCIEIATLKSWYDGTEKGGA